MIPRVTASRFSLKSASSQLDKTSSLCHVSNSCSRITNPCRADLSHFSRGYHNELKFTKSHYWVKVEGDIGTIGITPLGLKQMGDVVFLELPEVNRLLHQHEAFGTIESSKTTIDIQSPVSGQVLEINQKLVDQPSLLKGAGTNDDWLVKLKLSSTQEMTKLLDNETYEGMFSTDH